MSRVTTEIERLGFEHSCVGLARQLTRRPGIQRVDVDERTSRATITYDDTRLTASDVTYFIAEAGYEPRDAVTSDDTSDGAADSAGAA
jgi:copper chaperone CopZ